MKTDHIHAIIYGLITHSSIHATYDVPTTPLPFPPHPLQQPIARQTGPDRYKFIDFEWKPTNQLTLPHTTQIDTDSLGRHHIFSRKHPLASPLSSDTNSYRMMGRRCRRGCVLVTESLSSLLLDLKCTSSSYDALKPNRKLLIKMPTHTVLQALEATKVLIYERDPTKVDCEIV